MDKEIAKKIGDWHANAHKKGEERKSRYLHFRAMENFLIFINTIFFNGFLIHIFS